MHVRHSNSALVDDDAIILVCRMKTSMHWIDVVGLAETCCQDV